MPNKITYNVKTTNSTRKVLYWNPVTLSYTTDNPILNIPAGTYSGLKARFEGSPEIIATTTKTITVLDGAKEMVYIMLLGPSQSNGSGASPTSTPQPLGSEYTAVIPNTFIWNKTQNKALPYQQGNHDQALTRVLMGGDTRYDVQSFGWDLSFAKAYRQDTNNTNKKLFFLKIDVENVTSSDGASLLAWSKSGGLMDQLVSQWNAMKVWLDTNNYDYTFIGRFSEIGEQDSTDYLNTASTTGPSGENPNFESDYLAIHTRFVQEIQGGKEIPVILEAKVRPSDAGIRAKQLVMALKNRYFIFTKPNADFIFDGTHFTQAESLLRGIRTHNALKAGLAPTLISLSPASQVIGDTIVLSGTNFKNDTIVKFGTITVASTDVTVVSDTQINVKVPTGATSGTVSVTTVNGTASRNDFILNTQVFNGFITPLTFTHDELDYPSISPVGSWTRADDPNAIAGAVHYSDKYGQQATKRIRISSPQKLDIYCATNPALGRTQISLLRLTDNVDVFDTVYSQSIAASYANPTVPTFTLDIPVTGDYLIIFQKADNTTEYITNDKYTFRNAS